MKESSEELETNNDVHSVKDNKGPIDKEAYRAKDIVDIWVR